MKYFPWRIEMTHFQNTFYKRGISYILELIGGHIYIYVFTDVKHSCLGVSNLLVVNCDSFS